MQIFNFNLSNAKLFINWLEASRKKEEKNKVAKAAAAIPNSIPPAPIPFPISPPPIPVMEISVPVIEIPTSVIEVSPPIIEIIAPVIEVPIPVIKIPTPILLPSTLMDRVTVLDLPSPISPSIYQRIIPRLSIRNISYLILIAGVVVCVAYFLYSWKTNKKNVEKIPPEEKNRPVIIKEITISENRTDPVNHSYEALQEETAISKRSIFIDRSDKEKMGVVGAIALFVIAFFNKKSSLTPASQQVEREESERGEIVKSQAISQDALMLDHTLTMENLNRIEIQESRVEELSIYLLYHTLTMEHLNRIKIQETREDERCNLFRQTDLILDEIRGREFFNQAECIMTDDIYRLCREFLPVESDKDCRATNSYGPRMDADGVYNPTPTLLT